MKITRELRREIRRQVIKASGVTNPIIELGDRYDATGRTSTNGLRWLPDADIYETLNLEHETEIDEHPEIPGAATLDCYVYSRGYDGQLECNVYVTIKDGKIADCHQADREADKRTLAILGVPFSA